MTVVEGVGLLSDTQVPLPLTRLEVLALLELLGVPRENVLLGGLDEEPESLNRGGTFEGRERLPKGLVAYELIYPEARMAPWVLGLLLPGTRVLLSLAQPNPGLSLVPLITGAGGVTPPVLLLSSELMLLV